MNDKVFMSYSHDTVEHRARVLALSQRLRTDGVETILDQYVPDGSPDQGWPRWMLDGLDEATRVLCICTPTYYLRFRGHAAPSVGKGVDWEGAIITQELYDARNRTSKFIPVQLDRLHLGSVPEPLRSKKVHVLATEADYQGLYEVLIGMSGEIPAEVGERRYEERRPAAAATFPLASAPAAPASSGARPSAGSLADAPAALTMRQSTDERRRVDDVVAPPTPWFRDLPLRWEREETRAILELFRAAFKRTIDLLDLAQNCGLDIGGLDQGAKPKYLVKEILESARRAGRLENLLVQVLDDPELGGLHQGLRRTLVDWEAALRAAVRERNEERRPDGRGERMAAASAAPVSRDWAALERASARARRAVAARVPASALCRVVRTGFDRLVDAVKAGSLVLCGEAGQGKTMLLLALADRLAADGHPIVFVSGERIPPSVGDLERELGNSAPLAQAFDDARPMHPAFLLVDTLDATFADGARTLVIEKLIEAARFASPPLHVIATTRTYDILNKKKWRDLFPGTGVDGHVVDGLKARHYQVQPFDDAELDGTLEHAPGVLDAVRAASAETRKLFSIPFLLHLAVEIDPTGGSIAGVRTKRSILDQHWEHLQGARDDLRASRALAAQRIAVARMEARSSRPADLAGFPPELLDAVATLKLDGVLAGSDTDAGFAQDIFFDFHLARHLDGHSHMGRDLLLHPEHSIRVRGAIEQWLDGRWRDARPEFWRLMRDVFAPGVPGTAHAAFTEAVSRNAADDGDLAPLVEEVGS